MAGTVPSTLHQKVKFVVEEKLFNVATEEDIVAMLTTSNSYIDVDKNAIECSFQSLEVVNAIFVGMDKKILIPRLSNVTKMGSSKLLVKGHELDIGSIFFL